MVGIEWQVRDENISVEIMQNNSHYFDTRLNQQRILRINAQNSNKPLQGISLLRIDTVWNAFPLTKSLSDMCQSNYRQLNRKKKKNRTSSIQKHLNSFEEEENKINVFGFLRKRL